MDELGVVIAVQEGDNKYSASGFLLDARRGLVVTSAAWLREIIKLQSCTSGGVASVSWWLTPGSAFQTLANTSPLKWWKTQVVAVQCIPGVQRAVTSYLNHVDDGRGDMIVSRDQQSDSETIYLSSVVLLQVTEWPYTADNSYSVWSDTHSLSAGHPLAFISTPFGSLFPDVFLNSVSHGCLSNHFGCHGDAGSVFLTDARCVPGCEGGVVTLRRGSHDLITVVGLVVTQISDLDGRSLGFSLCVSIRPIIKALSCHLTTFEPGILFPDDFHHGNVVHPGRVNLNTLVPIKSVVMVTSGSGWGSGLLLFNDIVLTCAHVTPNTAGVTVRSGAASAGIPAHVLYRAPPLSAPDITVLRLSSPMSESSPVATPLFSSLEDMRAHLLIAGEELVGEDVLAIGHCLTGPRAVEGGDRWSPTVTRGVVAKVVKGQGKVGVVMLQTTAAVYKGMSGGLLLCYCHGNWKALGILTAHANEDSTGLAQHTVSFATPLSWLCHGLSYLLTHKGEQALKNLSTPQDTALWTLNNSASLKSRL